MKTSRDLFFVFSGTDIIVTQKTGTGNCEINGAEFLSYLSREGLYVTVTVNNALELNSLPFNREISCVFSDLLVEGIP